MRVITLLLLLAGCAGEDTDPPDPISLLPRSGQWDVEAFHWERICDGGSDKVTLIGETYVRSPEDRLWLSWGEFRHDYDYDRCPMAEDGSFACPPRIIDRVLHEGESRQIIQKGSRTLTGQIISAERMDVTEHHAYTCEPAENCFKWVTCDALEVATLVWLENPW